MFLPSCGFPAPFVYVANNLQRVGDDPAMHQFKAAATTVLLALFAVPFATAADARATYRFNLPEQSLSEALKAIGQQTTTNILFDPQSVLNKTAPALRATLTTQQAIDHVLKGTNLSAKQSAADTVLVQPPRANAIPLSTSEKGEASLSTLEKREGARASGKAEEKGFWNRLRLAQAEPPSPGEGRGTEGESDAAADKKLVELAEVVVTGTHIRGIQPITPVITIDRADIEQSSATTLPDLMRQIPQNFSGAVGETISLNSRAGDGSANRTRSTALDLRGLGSSATLTLINGRRMAPSERGEFVDISSIPLSAIERVEILPDGASAIYGSDAIAGVVNIVLRESYVGAETAVAGGRVTDGGYDEWRASQTLGDSWTSGGALLSVEYSESGTLQAGDRKIASNAPAATSILLPQDRQSAFLSANQSLLPGTEIFGTALASRRRGEVEEFSSAGTRPTTGHVENEGLASTIGLRTELPANWRIEFAGSFSRTRSEAATFIPSLAQTSTFRGESTGKAVDVKADGQVDGAAGWHGEISDRCRLRPHRD